MAGKESWKRGQQVSPLFESSVAASTLGIDKFKFEKPDLIFKVRKVKPMLEVFGGAPEGSPASTTSPCTGRRRRIIWHRWKCCWQCCGSCWCGGLMLVFEFVVGASFFDLFCWLFVMSLVI